MSSTDWHAYEVPQLASIVNEDLTEGWNHVWAWTLATDMLNAARDQLEIARASLGAVWTAEKSPAAQEFFTFVDAVSESMAATASAAAANRTAMQQVLDSQAATQTAVNELHGAWQTWSRDPLDPTDAQSVRNDLNARAAAHMTTADLVISDATNALTVPPVFDPWNVFNQLTVLPGTDGTRAAPGSRGAGSIAGESSSAGTAPTPRLTGGSTSSGTDEGVEGGGFTRPPGLPIGIGGGAQGNGTGAPRSGGGLGSTENSPEPLPTNPKPREIGANYPAAGPVGAYPSQASYRSAGLHRGILADAATGNPRQPPLGSPGTVAPGGAGEIGYVDGSPVASPRSSAAPGISGGNSGEAGLVSPMMFGGSSWGSSRSGRRNAGAFPWDVPVGVPAILVPAVDDETHDPGPGVIGIDR